MSESFYDQEPDEIELCETCGKVVPCRGGCDKL